MDQYEDLQKFREKTHMKSIRFVDFTKQNKEVNHEQWSIVQQLANKQAPLTNPTSPDLASQILNASLTNKAPESVHLAPLATTSNAATSAAPLFKDVSTQLNRPEAFQNEVHSSSSLLMDAQQPSSVQTQPQFQPQPIVQTQPQFQPQPVVQTEPQFQPQPIVPAKPTAQSQTNFSHLFMTPVDDTPVAEKDAPLQSILKRIATCR